MDAVIAPVGMRCVPGYVSLAELAPGMRACVVSVGSSASALSALERRLLELGFVHGEQIEILAEARPGRDPFVVRVGHTTLALRRREAESIWVELQHSGAEASPQAPVADAREQIEIRRVESSVPLQAALAGAPAPTP